jgi:hypothetical protein
MTAIGNTMSNNEYWNKVSCSPSAYFDECPLNLINDILNVDNDYFDLTDTIIKQENEEESSSSDVKFLIIFF